MDPPPSDSASVVAGDKRENVLSDETDDQEDPENVRNGSPPISDIEGLLPGGEVADQTQSSTLFGHEDVKLQQKLDQTEVEEQGHGKPASLHTQSDTNLNQSAGIAEQEVGGPSIQPDILSTTPPPPSPQTYPEHTNSNDGNSPASQPEAQNNDDVGNGANFPMALDVDSHDSDSALGVDTQSSTMSLRSSVFEYIEENGRTYHKFKQGNYYLPNDEVEQSRLDLQHHLFLLTLDGRLGLAPVQNPNFVLDIGTGTGIWAIEYAQQHPEASVTGIDLSPIQPEYVPPNCSFEVDDCEEEWTYSRQPEYIHGRALFTCFQDPKAVFQRAYDALAPGGYFEMQDILFRPSSNDDTVEGTRILEWSELLIKGAANIGRDWYCTLKYAQWMSEVGFEEVVENKFAWPLNTWPKGRKQKTMGLWMLTNALEGMQAISMAMMTRSLGMPSEEVELMLVDVRKDAKDKAIHTYFPVYVVYGRKPL